MTPYYEADGVRIFHGDCLDVLRGLPDASVDAVVTDPPYGLEFMGKAWDSFKGEAWRSTAGMSKPGIGERETAWPSFGGESANATCATCGGRMRGANKCACQTPDWRVKGKPFANRNAEHMRAFQQWCEQWATECLRVLKPGGHMLAFGGTRTWHRLACAVEDAGFEIRPSIAWLYGSGFPKSLNVGKAIDAKFCRAAGLHDHAPGEMCDPTPEGDPWRGHGTDTKPAFEPVVVARKPIGGTIREHCHNCRDIDAVIETADCPVCNGNGYTVRRVGGTVAANVLAWGTGALNIDGCRIDGSEPTARGNRRDSSADPDGLGGGTFGIRARSVDEKERQAGRWPANVVLDSDQAAALDAMTGESGGGPTTERGSASGGIWSESTGKPAGPQHGDVGGASRFFYTAKAPGSERVKLNGTAHPTVKPLDLMRWLIRLVTPPGGVVLEPFAGSGTTVEAAILEGFRCIAIEREADYLPLIMQRIHRQRDPVAAVAQTGDDGGLFDLLEEGA